MARALLLLDLESGALEKEIRADSSRQKADEWERAMVAHAAQLRGRPDNSGINTEVVLQTGADLRQQAILDSTDAALARQLINRARAMPESSSTPAAGWWTIGVFGTFISLTFVAVSLRMKMKLMMTASTGTT